MTLLRAIGFWATTSLVVVVSTVSVLTIYDYRYVKDELSVYDVESKVITAEKIVVTSSENDKSNSEVQIGENNIQFWSQDENSRKLHLFSIVGDSKGDVYIKYKDQSVKLDSVLFNTPKTTRVGERR